MIDYKDNFRPDGKRWACPYCTAMIEGSFEMMKHIEQKHGVVKEVTKHE